MSRSLRQTIVLVLILLWNTAGVYATVCSARCAEAAYAQGAAQSSLDGPSHGMQVRSGATRDPSRSDPCCRARLHGKTCVIGSSQARQPEFSSVQPSAVTLAPVAFALAPGAGRRTHSPPGFPSGRGLCHKLSLLRI